MIPIPIDSFCAVGLQLQLNEKFFYDYRFHYPHTPVWRHQERGAKGGGWCGATRYGADIR